MGKAGQSELMDERFTYFALLLVWALPPIVLQWVAGWKWLNLHRRAWLLGILIPTVWLVIADSTALNVVWTIAPSKSTGILLLNVPVEEAVFFLLTNTLVVQSFLLIYHTQELAAHWRKKFSQVAVGDKKSHEPGS
jgi:lycopene cyclase domain-containing protein